MQTSEEQALSQQKSGRYLKIAVAFLFLLAITWSIDVSFIYFFLGGTIYCLFMAIRHYPFKETQRTQREDTRQHRQRENAGRAPDQGQTYNAPPTPTATTVNRQKAIRVFVIFGVVFFGLFMLGVIASLIGGDDFGETWVYTERAQQYYDAGQYDSAQLYYRKALKSNPDDGDVALGYGKTLSSLEQYDSALIMLEKALVANPSSQEAQYYKAWVYFSRQDYSKAEELLKVLIEDDPTYVDPMRLMGSVYYAQKRNDEAIGWFERVYATGERSQWLCYIMAYIYDVKGDNAKAIEFYKEALTYDDSTDDSTIEINQRLGELLPGEAGNAYRTEAVRRQQGN